MQRNELCLLLSVALGAPVGGIESFDYSFCMRQAHEHGVSNMLYYAVMRLPEHLQPERAVRQALKKLAYAAATRDAIQEKELAAIKACFEEKRINMLPLKGCVIKHAYPVSAMRHMSDTDILINPMDAFLIREIMENLGFKICRFDQGDTDCYISPTGMYYEIHKSLQREGFNRTSEQFLDAMLSFGRASDGYDYVLSLPYEEHYAYILCHFVKHFINGGIGIRQVMDVFICRREWQMDETRLMSLLTELDLYAFSLKLEQLANNLFSDGEGDSVTDELCAYLLGSGVFGKEEQKVADRMLKHDRKGNKCSYLLKRLFPNYKTMSVYYPTLKKLPFLLPLFWLWRMIYALMFRNRKLRNEASTLGKTDESVLRKRAEFYRRCGLNVYSEE